ncbi:MAG: hypothetical protein SynsKO_24900 [Synoicihabitans sp.]
MEQGFREEPIGEAGGVPLIAFTKRTAGTRPRIYLSAGVHGDEPAPPQALLALLEAGYFDDRATWFLIPMLNPTGFQSQTRENQDGADLNRDYLDLTTNEVSDHITWLRHQPPFDLALCLHEDWEATGFYLYELTRTDNPARARTVQDATREFLPVEPGEEIDGRPVTEPGIIRPESDPALRELWPEAIYLFAHHTDWCFTFETPSAAPLAQRLDAQIAACKAAIDLTLSSPPLLS